MREDNGKNLVKENTNINSKEKKGNVARISVIGEKTNFSTVEAYRTARTNLMFSLIDEEGCKKVVLTSAMPGDGKTITCINLAITFAQAGLRVLLVDCDLRRPRVHVYLDRECENGLGDVLIDMCTVDEVLMSSKGIDFIPAGQMSQNPAELLSSKKMKSIINELSENYDYIFFDTPPIGLVTDVSGFMGETSGVVVVVRQNHTMHKAIEGAMSSLNFANAKILGFILNDATLDNYSKRKRPYSSYGDYGDYGDYGSYGSYGGYKKNNKIQE